jgi:hypothetical protein
MEFHVGPWVYKVIVTADDPLKDEQGRDACGICDRDRREILLVASIPATSRLAVLLHELFHAWLFHVPRPRTEEEICELGATIIGQAYTDLLAAGGPAAVEALSVECAKAPKMLMGPPSESTRAPAAAGTLKLAAQPKQRPVRAAGPEPAPPGGSSA